MLEPVRQRVVRVEQRPLPLKAIADVDRPGVRIAVGLGSAYDLYLTRTIKNATIVRAATAMVIILLVSAEKRGIERNRRGGSVRFGELGGRLP